MTKVSMSRWMWCWIQMLRVKCLRLLSRRHGDTLVSLTHQVLTSKVILRSNTSAFFLRFGNEKCEPLMDSMLRRFERPSIYSSDAPAKPSP
jgi:hypothetical protein